MLRTHRAGKGPGGSGGMGFKLKEQKAPRRAPHLWSQRVGDLTCEPSSLPGLEWAWQMPFSPLLLLLFFLSWRVPPTCLSCSPLGLLPMPPGPMQLRGRGDLEGRGQSWELTRLPGPEWAGQISSTVLLLLLASLLLASPDLSGLPPMLLGPPTQPGGGFGGGTGLGVPQAPWAE